MFYNIYNVNFEIAAFCFILILYFYLRRKYYNNIKINKNFRRLVFSQLLTLFLDLATSYTISYSSNIPYFLNTLLNTIYFAALGLTCYMFGMFYLSFTQGTNFGKMVQNLFKFFLAVFYVLLFENLPTGILFSFSNGRYEHGPLYMLCFILPMLYFIFGIAVVFYAKKTIRKTFFALLMLLAILTITGPVVQALFFPKILLSNFFSIFALVLCLFLLISPDYAELSKKRSQLLEFQRNLEQRVKEESQKALKNEEKMRMFSIQMIDALARTINIGSSNREDHSENVGKLSQLIAEEMGLDEKEVQKIYYMGILHDIGIIGVNEDVIEKKGTYTEEEYGEMKKHCEIGSRILKTITELPGIDEGARSHHERFDGYGYPDSLSRKDIPLSGRIIALADAYDAMTHDRTYKKVYSHKEALEEIKLCAGSQFDPDIVEYFLRAMNKQ